MDEVRFRRVFTLLLAVILLVMLVALLLVGCGRSDPSAASSASQTQPVAPQPGALRVVTLAPALSQMMVDMGLGQQIVGVAEYDASAPAGLPIVGNYRDVNTEKLLAARPSHVMMMTGKEGLPPALQELSQAAGFSLITWQAPLTVAAIATILYDGSNSSLAAALGQNARGRQLRQQMLSRLLALKQLTEHAAEGKPRVLLLIGTGPLMASGAGTVLDELLTRYLNAVNAAGDSRVGAPVFDREKLLAARPDVVVAVLPGAPPLKSIGEDARLAELREMDLPAVRNQRVVLVDDLLMHLPSSNIDRVAAALAKAIYPDLANRIDALMHEEPALTGQEQNHPGLAQAADGAAPAEAATQPVVAR